MACSGTALLLYYEVPVFALRLTKREYMAQIYTKNKFSVGTCLAVLSSSTSCSRLHSAVGLIQLFLIPQTWHSENVLCCGLYEKDKVSTRIVL
jgi:hypothetical protein